jgi:uncharacterized protein
MMALYSGRDVAQESLGLAPMRFVVVQTDGSYELVDSLRVAFDGASATGLDVFTNSLDELVMQPSIAVRQIGILGLSETCRECEHVLECGGGMYAHRYRHDTGFLNASVYCADMSKLLTHVRQRMRDTSYVS